MEGRLVLTCIAFRSSFMQEPVKTGRRARHTPLSPCEKGWVPLRHFTMTRKDSEKDADRMHYYSQFWLDVAAGRRIIGAPKPEDEAAEAEVLDTHLPARKSARSVSYDDSDDIRFDGHAERIVHPVAEPLATPEEFIESEPEEKTRTRRKTRKKTRMGLPPTQKRKKRRIWVGVVAVANATSRSDQKLLSRKLHAASRAAGIRHA
jgi:hypothetical protein